MLDRQLVVAFVFLAATAGLLPLRVLEVVEAAPDRPLDRDSIVFPDSLPRNPVNKDQDDFHAIVDSSAQENNEENIGLKKVTYDGAQVWNIELDHVDKLRIVGSLSRNNEISAWGGNHSAVDFLIKPQKLSKISNILSDNNIRYRIVIDDLQRYIDEENPDIVDEDMQDRKAKDFNFWHAYRATHGGRLTMPVVKPANRRMAMYGAYMGYNALDERMEYWPTANWGHRMTWQKYHRVDDIHGFMDYLAVTYPQFCSVKSIGKSVEGRDLKVLRISSGGEGKKAVWIDGGIHAREWISPATVTYIINYFVENFENESEAVRKMEWYFLPIVNPDGYEYTHKIDRLWRKNRKTSGFGACSGVDLNRNFNYKWGGQGTSTNKCSEIYAGTGPFSEPESKAIADFIATSNSNFKLYVSYHSYGQYILYPWGYDRVYAEDNGDLERAGKAAAIAISKKRGTQYKVGVSSVVLYPAAGGSDDWAKGVANIKYSYTIELSDTGRYGFVLPASYIVPVAEESLAGLREIADAAYAA